jgi:hypothetical protein
MEWKGRNYYIEGEINLHYLKGACHLSKIGKRKALKIINLKGYNLLFIILQFIKSFHYLSIGIFANLW